MCIEDIDVLEIMMEIESNFKNATTLKFFWIIIE